ncbi:hypothetical protein LSM04_008602 [Trypanosoma melophagium]|uniref:uncharacterized protein n=1 Tax=Trypanosoma melophagium TaxID=715481 RepID=UPI00351A0C50|nr:hypothetical protein LSM04_008602 [Trypanosoma melophagium]
MRTPPVSANPLTCLVCCVALLLLCAPCTAENIVLLPSSRGSYDTDRALCQNAGGDLVEARSAAIVRTYTSLMKDAFSFSALFTDVNSFLAGSRDLCASSFGAICACNWCWRPDWTQPCKSSNVFYYSAIWPWGRAAPGMYVNWAFLYPGGPRQWQFVGHSYLKRGWIDARHHSLISMTHTLCDIKSPTEPTAEPASSFSGNPLTDVFGNEAQVLNRRGVKSNWWIIMGVCLIAGGALIAAACYFIISAMKERGRRVSKSLTMSPMKWMNRTTARQK